MSARCRRSCGCLLPADGCAETSGDLAAWYDDLAAQAVADREYELADCLYEASDSYGEPSEAVRTARILLLVAAIAAEAGR